MTKPGYLSVVIPKRQGDQKKTATWFEDEPDSRGRPEKHGLVKNRVGGRERGKSSHLANPRTDKSNRVGVMRERRRKGDSPKLAKQIQRAEKNPKTEIPG